MARHEITVTVEPLTRFDALEAKWRALENRAEPSFFQTWTWIGSWLNLAKFTTSPRIIEATRNGTCLGLGILSSRRTVRNHVVVSHGLYLNETGDLDQDLITIEYNGLLADRQCLVQIEAACLRWLVECDQSWNEIHLAGVPERYVELGRHLGLGVWIRQVASSPVVELTGLSSIDDLLRRISANSRRQYLRSLHFYQARGQLTFDVAQNVAQAHDYFAELKCLHIRRWQSLGRPHAFRSPFFERFHLNLIEHGLPEGKIELLRLSVDGHAVGYLYNFFHQGAIYNYQCGFEYERSAHARPGLVCHIAAIGRAIERGARSYDLLAGATRFKGSIASHETRSAWLTLQRPELMLRAEGAARALKRWLGSRRGAFAPANRRSS